MIDAVFGGADKEFKMAGTGSKQEDQIITVALEKVTGGKHFTYVPVRGGGAVAVQLVGKHVHSSVNTPIEAVAHWRAGALRPLCIFDAKRSTRDAFAFKPVFEVRLDACRRGRLRRVVHRPGRRSLAARRLSSASGSTCASTAAGLWSR